MPGRRCILSVQSPGEFFVLAVREALAAPATAQQAMADPTVTFAMAAPTAADAGTAAAAAVAGRPGHWDAPLLATRDRAGCTAVPSKEMADGAVHGGVTVSNPFERAAC